MGPSSAVLMQDNGNNSVDRNQSSHLAYSLVKILPRVYHSRAKAESGSLQESISENRTMTKGHDGRKRNSGFFFSFRMPAFSHFIRGNQFETAYADSVPDIVNPNPMPTSGLENAVCKLQPLPQVTSIPGMYSRLFLTHRHGYPLYQPESDFCLPLEYRKRGISIGDVGLVTRDGSFDFLFNVCLSRANVNPRDLPNNFERLRSDDFSFCQYLPPETHLFSSTVSKINDSSVIGSRSTVKSNWTARRPAAYTCSGHEGVVLELPKGALLYDARNKYAFRDLAARHAQDWFRYMIINKARDAPNGSLYLVTGCVKAKDWGSAVFNRPSSPQDHLSFTSDDSPQQDQNTRPMFSWKKTGAMITKIGPNAEDVITAEGEEPNQCLFLRGYKIMLRHRVWDELVKGGSISPEQMAATNSGGQTEPWGSDSAATLKQDQGLVMLKEHFNGSLIHPSDFVNTMLLQSEPRAQVALTHDDDWCTTLPNPFTTTNSCLKVDELYRNVSKAYAHVVDDYGCVSLIEKEADNA